MKIYLTDKNKRFIKSCLYLMIGHFELSTVLDAGLLNVFRRANRCVLLAGV